MWILLMVALISGLGNAFLIPGGLQSVVTGVGEIHGELANVQFDGKTLQVRRFLGIPYAKPPVGDLRFNKPEPLSVLPQSPFKALQYGDICPQPFAEVYTTKPRSENCLFLNLFAPASTDFASRSVSTPKAVMVWIHGGGFVVGWSDSYDSSILASFTDVIVVTLNYRLGPLGFFSTHDDTAPGNYGLWDQQLAIQWVRDNIAAFGGDPDNISIFGESAGSSSVVYQAMYPGNRGLVKRAIAESGTVAAWGLDRNGTNYKNSMGFAEYSGCQRSNGAAMLACLRSKSESEIKVASEKFQETHSALLLLDAWVPVHDGVFVAADTHTVLHDLNNVNFKTDYAETFRSIDFMIGETNLDGLVYLDDWLMIMNHTSGLNGKYGFSRKAFTDVIMPIMAELVLDEKPTPLVLEAMKYEYTNWEDPDNATKRLVSLVDMTTDLALNAPSILTANGHEVGDRATYVYQFAASPPGPSVSVPAALQSETATAHADELVFLFGFPDVLRNFTGNFSEADISPEHTRISKTMMTMWTNFAKSGNPNTPTDLQQYYSGLVWPEYDTDDGKYLQISPRMSKQSAKTRLAARAVYFWNYLLPELQALSKTS